MTPHVNLKILGDSKEKFGSLSTTVCRTNSLFDSYDETSTSIPELAKGFIKQLEVEEEAIVKGTPSLLIQSYLTEQSSLWDTLICRYKRFVPWID